MALNPQTTRDFIPRLYAGMLQTVILLKRDNDQRQGTVRAVTLVNCRQSMVFKHGEPIQADWSTQSRCVWHIPKVSMEMAGVAYINATDRIDNRNATFGVPGIWQAEANTEIIVKLFGNVVNVHCLRIDPPAR